MTIDLNFLGRCRDCGQRPAGNQRSHGLDALIGGICRRCWDKASTRIRTRFAGDTDGELRYSFHGHARPFHSTKRKSTSRAEHVPGTDPAEGGRDESGAQHEPETASAPTAAATGAGSSAAPAFCRRPWTDQERIDIRFGIPVSIH